MRDIGAGAAGSLDQRHDLTRIFCDVVGDGNLAGRDPQALRGAIAESGLCQV
jgi:hypothetical protein